MITRDVHVRGLLLFLWPIVNAALIYFTDGKRFNASWDLILRATGGFHPLALAFLLIGVIGVVATGFRRYRVAIPAMFCNGFFTLVVAVGLARGAAESPTGGVLGISCFGLIGIMMLIWTRVVVRQVTLRSM